MAGSTHVAGTRLTDRGFAQGNVLVDPNSGLPIDVIVDSAGKRRLAVDTVINIDNLSVDVDLDVATDGVHIGDKDTGNALVVNSDGSINVNAILTSEDDSVSIGNHNTPLFLEGAGTVSTALYETIFTYTATADSRLIKLDCVADTVGSFRIKINGSTKRLLRNSSLFPNVEFIFMEHRPLLNGDVLIVEFKVDRQFCPTYSTFTSLEGYIK